MKTALQQRLQQTKRPDPVDAAMLNLLVAASEVRERIERVCSEFGVTNGQYNVLRILRGAGPDGLARCEIAERMIDRAPDVTRLVDRLETQGLVERQRCSEDRRRSLTTITKKGLRLLEEMEEPLAEVGRWFAGRVGGADRKQLSRICSLVFGD